MIFRRRRTIFRRCRKVFRRGWTILCCRGKMFRRRKRKGWRGVMILRSRMMRFRRRGMILRRGGIVPRHRKRFPPRRPRILRCGKSCPPYCSQPRSQFAFRLLGYRRIYEEALNPVNVILVLISPSQFPSSPRACKAGWFRPLFWSVANNL